MQELCTRIKLQMPFEIWYRKNAAGFFLDIQISSETFCPKINHGASFDVLIQGGF